MSLPNYTEHTRAISANLTPLRNDMPDLMKAFGDMAAAATRRRTGQKNQRADCAGAGHCWPLRCLHRLSR